MQGGRENPGIHQTKCKTYREVTIGAKVIHRNIAIEMEKCQISFGNLGYQTAQNLLNENIGKTLQRVNA